jgi:hypothetical protein
VTTPFDVALFLSGVLTGSKATQQRHLWQARIMQAAIQQRWRRDNPWTWQLKACAVVSHSSPERPLRRHPVLLSAHCPIGLEAIRG